MAKSSVANWVLDNVITNGDRKRQTEGMFLEKFFDRKRRLPAMEKRKKTKYVGKKLHPIVIQSL